MLDKPTQIYIRLEDKFYLRHGVWKIPYAERLCLDGQRGITSGIQGNWLRRIILILMPQRSGLRRRLLERV